MSEATPSRARTQSEAETYQRLRAHLGFLKLTDAAEALPRLLDEARMSKLPLIETLEALLGVEVAATEERRLVSRLRFACLPAPWRLADFDFSAQPGIDEHLIRELATLRFIEEGANVLFIGPPGVGKTMLAVGLARAGAEAGHRVYFTTASDLAARCRKAAIEGRWATMMRFYAGPRLLVLDLCRPRNYADSSPGSPVIRRVGRVGRPGGCDLIGIVIGLRERRAGGRGVGIGLRELQSAGPWRGRVP